MIALALLLSWSAVTLDCAGRPELAVTYVVPAAIGAMTFVAWCPLDLDGNAQRCAVWTDVSVQTAGLSVTLPDPAVGEVLLWKDPVTEDAAGNRSDQTGGCAP